MSPKSRLHYARTANIIILFNLLLGPDGRRERLAGLPPTSVDMWYPVCSVYGYMKWDWNTDMCTGGLNLGGEGMLSWLVACSQEVAGPGHHATVKNSPAENY